MPKLGSEVKTEDGKGIVVYNDLLKRLVDVKFANGDEVEVKTYELDKVKFRKEE